MPFKPIRHAELIPADVSAIMDLIADDAGQRRHILSASTRTSLLRILRSLSVGVDVKISMVSSLRHAHQEWQPPDPDPFPDRSEEAPAPATSPAPEPLDPLTSILFGVIPAPGQGRKVTS